MNERLPAKLRLEIEKGADYYAHQLGKVQAGEKVHQATAGALARRRLAYQYAGLKPRLTDLGVVALDYARRKGST